MNFDLTPYTGLCNSGVLSKFRNNTVSGLSHVRALVSGSMEIIHQVAAHLYIYFFFEHFFYFHEIMTHIQYMMMMMNVQADYGYIEKKS